MTRQPSGPAGTEAWARIACCPPLLERILHDLKQPLNLIRILAQDVRIDQRKERLDRASLPERMMEIERAVDEMAARLGQVRAFLRPDGDVDRLAAADPEAVCRDVVARVRRAGPPVEIAERLAPGMSAVALERPALEQALWELIDNAVRATVQAGESSPVDLTAEEHGRQVVLAVHDHGGGIPPESLPRIFDPFFTTRAGAPGLGLTLAATLAARAGGTLICTGSSGRGSVFELRLPVSP